MTSRRVLFFWTLGLVSLAVHTLNADTVRFTDNYGTASASVPAYYVPFCGGGSCTVVDSYPLTVAADTIAPIIYIGNHSGYVSDKIVALVGPPANCTPAPACFSQITAVNFTLTSGLDLTGSPFTCVSVGGCSFTYDGSVQDMGSITWGPGLFSPTPGFSTDLLFQSLTGTILSQTLIDFAGGSASDPVFLPSQEPVGEVTGAIGKFGSEQYYAFSWKGGLFSASSSISGPNLGASYLFSMGSTSGCAGIGSTTLNGANSYTGTIYVPNLAAANYCIGITATDPADPPFTLTFNTPVNTTPEPSFFGLITATLVLFVLRRGWQRV
jgi:hypothetical protein